MFMCVHVHVCSSGPWVGSCKHSVKCHTYQMRCWLSHKLNRVSRIVGLIAVQDHDLFHTYRTIYNHQTHSMRDYICDWCPLQRGSLLQCHKLDWSSIVCVRTQRIWSSNHHWETWSCGIAEFTLPADMVLSACCCTLIRLGITLNVKPLCYVPVMPSAVQGNLLDHHVAHHCIQSWARIVLSLLFWVVIAVWGQFVKMRLLPPCWIPLCAWW
jgi:hypothetical protein